MFLMFVIFADQQRKPGIESDFTKGWGEEFWWSGPPLPGFDFRSSINKLKLFNKKLKQLANNIINLVRNFFHVQLVNLIFFFFLLN